MFCKSFSMLNTILKTGGGSVFISCSMGSMPMVSMTYFTKWLHFLLLIAISPYRVQISLLHQSTRSSVHLRLGLPLLFCHPLRRKQLALGVCRLASTVLVFAILALNPDFRLPRTRARSILETVCDVVIDYECAYFS